MTRASGPVTFVEAAKAKALSLRRVPFESKGIFDEKWIQDLVADHSEIIGVDSLDAAFAPAVTVGYELESGAGPIDVLLCSPRGLITIVETKLWRNAEMRRTVVAQILDYAKELRHWSYDDLDAESRKSMAKRDGSALSLWERVSQHPEAREMTESEFIDNVQRSLACGRFLLLIVGDGVKEGVEELVATIQGAPGLQYTLRLVELRCYHLDGGNDWPLIVIPAVIARTVDLVRAVVRVETRSEAGTTTNVHVEVDTLDIEQRVPAADTVRASSTVTWDEDSYFTALRTGRGGDSAADIGRRLYEWIEGHGLRSEWSGGPREGYLSAWVDHLGVEHCIFTASCFGYTSIQLGKLSKTPAFQDESRRREIIDRLNQIKGVRITYDRASLYPGVSMRQLESQAGFDQFRATLDWMLETIWAEAPAAS